MKLPWDIPKEAEKKRVHTSDAPYNTHRWHKLAKAFIERHPLCEECRRKGIVKAAECVDHIDPWPIGKDYFFDTRNLQALCNHCNNEKGNRDKRRIREWEKRQDTKHYGK